MFSVHEKPFGTMIEVGRAVIVFGNSNGPEELLKSEFPLVKFKRIKQTHSDIVVHSTFAEIPAQEADAHWSEERNLALCVLTADCLPIMIVDTKKSVVASVHAGWRGVLSGITEKTVKELITQGSDIKDIYLFIGPHIQASSFEIKSDIYPQLKDGVVEQVGNNGYKVSLINILKKNLDSLGLPADHVWISELDTCADKQFNSFRRDKTPSRQISLIFMENKDGGSRRN